MSMYLNKSGKSGIRKYDIGNDYIIVHFKSGNKRHYRYDYSKPGQIHVEKMKQLALLGEGLNSYISTTVKKNYSSCW